MARTEAQWADQMDGVSRTPAPPIKPTGERNGPMVNIYSVTQSIRVTNRADRGALKGKAIFLYYNSQIWPEDANPRDPSTLLAPGESMMLPRETVFGVFGCPWAPNLSAEDRDSMAAKFGGWETEPVTTKILTFGNIEVPSTPIGPPRMLPDVLLQQVTSAGKPVGDEVSVYDVYCDGVEFHKPSRK